MKIVTLLLLPLFMATTVNADPITQKGNLPMGYQQTWTARLLFNSEGGYA